MAKQALAASVAAMTATPKLTPSEEARLCNNVAWRLTVVGDPVLRHPQQAVSAARRAVELRPDSGNYWHTLGTALFYAGEYAAARDALLKSLTLESKAPRGTLDRWTSALKALPKGDLVAARTEIEASLGLATPAPQALSLHYSMLAMTQWKLGETEAAKESLKRVVGPASGFAAGAAEMRRLIGEARTLISTETTSN